jgi:hypothetical protein
MRSRADRHNNPTAFTINVAKQAGLVLGVDYEVGDPFPKAKKEFTAKLLKDPIETTIRVIDKIGYFTANGVPRWTYIQLPKFVWISLDMSSKIDVIGFHYEHEGGVEMMHLFPKYGKLA